ncbi:uncharacterized protein AMSG_08888 [Thecamonas trahens ATCC 50062]|uniref:Cation/H+ exchanger transmembrane domain-containing protein n=1 Tax=Thecamonas trahens ATCC 50062 TaxID=461836 RepID=A0A0L0DPM7_THETB|nr:hypothetical protein AMSG_08888 [Thecamonas trahens ATCC 50062]KNC53383.1 hypothetical protein AMSG_08888 [Thecamonas trahens ATCC 50062]|eukprot:XP_013754428.1 hypothetical protein AMSG_08888 [Thecamonas trahens ATCC 50062]
MALVVLFAGAALAGHVAPYLAMPPLLGMLVAGLVLRNVPGGLLDGFDDEWASVLKSSALAVILIRGGLGLSLPALKAMGMPTLRLSTIPVLVEAAAVGVLAMLFLDLPVAWALLLGFVLSAVSPAVVVPSLLKLQRAGYGVDAGIPTMILAAAGLDDVMAISGFGAFLGIAFASGSLLLNILRGPFELVGGLVLGTILGVLAIPLASAPLGWRTIGVALGGLGATLGGRHFEVTGTGALGTMVFGFVVRQAWGAEATAPVANIFRLAWTFAAEIVLFSLIGAAVELDAVKGEVVGKGLIMICISIVIRFAITVSCVLGTTLSWRERIFVAFAWLPKATVQAALGSIALDTARSRNESQDIIEQSVPATPRDDREAPRPRPLPLPLAPNLAPPRSGQRNASTPSTSSKRRPEPLPPQPMLEGTPWYPRSAPGLDSAAPRSSPARLPALGKDESDDGEYTYTYSSEL